MNGGDDTPVKEVKTLDVCAAGPTEYVKKSLHALIFSSYLNLLMLCTPFAGLAYYGGGSDGVVFALSLLAIAPFAERLSYVTEQLALYTSETLGGLLNATFGNVTELIVSLFALRAGMLRIVQVSLLGSILSNMLLVLGCAFFFGGALHTALVGADFPPSNPPGARGSRPRAVARSFPRLHPISPSPPSIWHRPLPPHRALPFLPWVELLLRPAAAFPHSQPPRRPTSTLITTSLSLALSCARRPALPRADVQQDGTGSQRGHAPAFGDVPHFPDGPPGASAPLPHARTRQGTPRRRCTGCQPVAMGHGGSLKDSRPPFGARARAREREREIGRRRRGRCCRCRCCASPC